MYTLVTHPNYTHKHTQINDVHVIFVYQTPHTIKAHTEHRTQGHTHTHTHTWTHTHMYIYVCVCVCVCVSVCSTLCMCISKVNKFLISVTGI